MKKIFLSKSQESLLYISTLNRKTQRKLRFDNNFVLWAMIDEGSALPFIPLIKNKNYLTIIKN